ncbi:MAG: hypothetical protein JO134_08255 [Xanthobacteraceae bacterium]|nr:hypothetical protein [Xanthobacteraceae bacterium]
MILPALSGLSLLVLASIGPVTDEAVIAHMSAQQKNAAVQVYVTRATECVARKVAADPLYAKDPNGIGDLIVSSMPGCAELMRAMIDSYDRYFGEGAGEAFFSGPYLDVLPTAVANWVKDSRPIGAAADESR